jgi:hypothetical protein
VHGKQIYAIGGGEMVKTFGDAPGTGREPPCSCLLRQPGYERVGSALSRKELIEQVAYVRLNDGLHN